MEALRKLQQDNDINAFRYHLERVLGNGKTAIEVARELAARFAASFADDRLDQMFNPK